jgi:hypothetical protein
MNSLAFSVLLFASVASAELVKVGDFQNYAHGINGQVFMKDQKTLVIKGFTYDGAGPDAFFWAGTSQAPSSVGTILPYPFDGKFYEYEDQSAPILSKRFNGEEIVLTLPETLKATDIKWLSVWCRAFQVNFGDLTFPEDLSFEDNSLDSAVLTGPSDDHEDEEGADAEGDLDDLPPPLLEPIHNAHDPNHRHDEDADALSEAESESAAESESESEPGSAHCFSLSFTASLLAVLGAYLF